MTLMPYQENDCVPLFNTSDYTINNANINDLFFTSFPSNRGGDSISQFLIMQLNSRNC